MKIYKLHQNVDGFGIMQDEYFESFDLALEFLKKKDYIFFEEDGTPFVYGVKETRGEIDRENGTLYITGIPYSQEECDEDPYCLRWCSISVSPVEFNFEIKDDKFYILKVKEGYRSYMGNAILTNFCGESDFDRNDPNSKSTILGYYRSKKDLYKDSKVRYRKYPRIWMWKNKKENEAINTLGGGEDYLTYEEKTVRRKQVA